MDKLEELNRLWRNRLYLEDLLAEANREISKITSKLTGLDFCQECQVYYLPGTDHVCQVDKE